MRAVDRTTKLFVESAREAFGDATINVVRSVNRNGGHSRYVYVRLPEGRHLKVRISDHGIGMRRYREGGESLLIPAGAGPANWAVWLSEVACSRREIPA